MKQLLIALALLAGAIALWLRASSPVSGAPASAPPVTAVQSQLPVDPVVISMLYIAGAIFAW